jgi:hypothetical protein
MKSTVLIVAIACLVSGMCGCIGPRSGRPHYFPVEAGATYLAEEQAIEIAKQTMVKEGYDLSAWQLKRSDAPKGKGERWVARFDPKQVRVLFSNGKEYREVSVVLQDGRVMSSMFFGL